MTKQRAEIGFASALDELEVTDWSPKPAEKKERPPVPTEDIQKAAKATGFNSRESATVKEEKKRVAEGRVYRTGRSDQLNLKVRPEDKNGFYEICDQNKWVQGFAFQRALEALQREQNAEKKKS